MQRILLIDDSTECQIAISRSLAQADIDVKVAGSLKEARATFRRNSREPIHLVLLDPMLPDGDGLEFLDELQTDESFKDIPVFLLSSRGEMSSKVTAFALGAEDYMVKPINPMELKARVQMRIRKMKRIKQNWDIVRKGKIVIQNTIMKASVEESGVLTDLDLTVKEFKILSFLAQNEGKVFSRSQLVKSVWDKSVHVLERTVDSHVCGLRRKLRSAADYIECIPGRGYRFFVDGVDAKPAPDPRED